MSSKNEQKREGETQCASIITETEDITTELQDIKKMKTSLVVQCLSIHLPVQEYELSILDLKESTCSRAATPVCSRTWAAPIEPSAATTEAYA